MKVLNTVKEYDGNGKLIKHSITIDLLNSNILGDAIHAIVCANDISDDDIETSIMTRTRYRTRVETAIEILEKALENCPEDAD